MNRTLYFLKKSYIVLYFSADGTFTALLITKHRCHRKTVAVRMTYNNWSSYLDVLGEHIITKGDVDIFHIKHTVCELTELKSEIVDYIEFTSWVTYHDIGNITRWSTNQAEQKLNYRVSNRYCIHNTKSFANKKNCHISLENQYF